VWLEIRAVTVGELGFPKVGKADRGAGQSPRTPPPWALLFAVDGGSNGLPSVLAQQLQICCFGGNDSGFPPVKQIPGLCSALTRRTLLLAGHACLAPGSIRGAEAEGLVQLSLISVGVCSSSVPPGWIREVAVQVQASLLLFFLKQLVS